MVFEEIVTFDFLSTIKGKASDRFVGMQTVGITNIKAAISHPPHLSGCYFFNIGNVFSINPGGKIKTSKSDSKVRKKTTR